MAAFSTRNLFGVKPAPRPRAGSGTRPIPTQPSTTQPPGSAQLSVGQSGNVLPGAPASPAANFPNPFNRPPPPGAEGPGQWLGGINEKAGTFWQPHERGYQRQAKLEANLEAAGGTQPGQQPAFGAGATSAVGQPTQQGTSSAQGVNLTPGAFGTQFGSTAGGVTAPPIGNLDNTFGSRQEVLDRGFGGIAMGPAKDAQGRQTGRSVAFGQPPQPTGPSFQGNTGGPGSGGSGGQQAGPNFDIQTSIEPGGVFTPDQTQIRVNQAVADSVIPLDFAMKPFIRPGSSRSQSTLSSALPAFTSGLSNAAQAQAQIPFQDAIANMNQLRAGEVAREDEFFELGNLQLRLLEQDQFSQRNLLQQLSGLAGSLI